MRSLQIDDEVEGGRQFHRQVAGVRTLQDLVEVADCLPVQVYTAYPKRHQHAGSGEPRLAPDTWQLLPKRKVGDEPGLPRVERSVRYVHGIDARRPHGREGRLDLLGALDEEYVRIHPQHPRCCLASWNRVHPGLT